MNSSKKVLETRKTIEYFSYQSLPLCLGMFVQILKKAAYSDTGFTRVIIEKPFGRDTNTFK